MKILISLLVLTLAPSIAPAQTPPPDGLVSPDVQTDRSVIFRVRAPKAATVTLSGDWLTTGKPEPMTNSGDGIWTIHTPPLEPNVHLYWFNLDGVAVADPVNPVVKLRQRTSASLVEVPADHPSPWDIRDVPHGSVVTEWYRSAVLNRTEKMVVYLPPGYDKGTARYPVLYLVHGSGDVPESWVQAGRANFILDNLIADGKAKPMIVVMPAGHAVPFGAPRGTTPSNNEQFEHYLVKEVIPTLEAKYRIRTGSQNRALAGLSMGGGHTVFTGFSHPELFSALGIFSPGLPRDFDTKFQSILANPKPFDAKVKLIWVACGDHDEQVQYPRVKAWAESLDSHGIHETFRTYPGGHTWPVWRKTLSDFVPLLFAGK